MARSLSTWKNEVLSRSLQDPLCSRKNNGNRSFRNHRLAVRQSNSKNLPPPIHERNESSTALIDDLARRLSLRSYSLHHRCPARSITTCSSVCRSYASRRPEWADPTDYNSLAHYRDRPLSLVQPCNGLHHPVMVCLPGELGVVETAPALCSSRG